MEKKILVVDDLADIRDIMAMIIESSFESVSILEAGSGEQAIEVLLNNPDIAMVFCDYNMPDGNGGDVYSYIKNYLGSSIPFVLVSTESPTSLPAFNEFEEDNSLNASLIKPFAEKQVTEQVSKILKNTQDEFYHQLAQNDLSYRKVNLERLLRNICEPINVDIYLKLSDQKFVRIFAKENFVQLAELNSLKIKGASYVYLTENDFKEYFRQQFKSLVAQVSDQSLTDEEMISVQQYSIGQIHDYAKQMGVDQIALELTDSIINSVQETIAKNSELYEFIKKMKHKGGYISAQSQITAYIAVAIAKMDKWDQPHILESLAAAALFQNVSLESDEFAKIQRSDSTEYKDLSSAEKKMIIDHPHASAKMIKGVKDFPQEVFNFILFHHQLPDGNGFPKGVADKHLTKIDCTFIIAQNFADRVVQDGFRAENILSIVKEMQKHFMVGHYRNPFEVFLKLFEKN